MYNKIIKTTVTAFMALTLVQSCSKKEVVELQPEFLLDGTRNPSSIKQFGEVLTGAYATLRGANYYGSGSGTGAGWSLMPDVLSDNLYEFAAQTLANSRTMADWIYNSGTGQVESFYNAPYATIAHANVIINGIDKYANSGNQTTVNRIKGQAFALRALAHFDLFRYFANNYDRTSTTTLALAYTKTFEQLNSANLPTPARISNKDYYDNLFADINQAITLLGNIDQAINTSALTRPYIDRNAVYALQARVNLYAGNWADAATAATNALASRPLATSQADFSGMFNQTARGEIIWNVQFDEGQSGPTFLVFFATSNRNYFRPAPEIVVTGGTSGLIQNNDLRYAAYFTTLGGLPALTKYRGKGTVTNGNANFPVFRSGEMYLIRAEANARLGGANEIQALADLNTLRASRIAGYTPIVATGATLLSEIATERRRELVGEGHRFFDLKRTTRVIQRGAICGTATSAAGNCTLAATAREWTLPIPQNVLAANPSLVQNAGY
jgi:hypothetical protein